MSESMGCVPAVSVRCRLLHMFDPERQRYPWPPSRSYSMLTNFQQTTLTFVDTQTWLASPEATEMTKRLMLEVIGVGQRCGVPLKNELVDVLMTRILSLPGIFSSMYVDAKEGRHLEIDVILGFPMRKAKEFGMDVPTLATLYALLKAVDGRLGV